MRKFLIVLLFLLAIALAFGYYAYKAIYSPNVILEDSEIITLSTGTDFDGLVKILREDGIIEHDKSFRQVAKLMKYGEGEIPTGKYEIKPNWSNKDLISLLRSGRQKPVKVTFNNLRTEIQVLGKISSYLEVDSSDLVQYFKSTPVKEKLQLDDQNLITLFIPNTYEMFWNVTKEEIVTRFMKENQSFWSKGNRADKADALEMSKEEVITLASIVEKESLRRDEKPTIAGVYLNRIQRGIPLQADPAVVFGLKAFELRRVLNKHLEIDTPYNTYMHAGLPPGPICLPSISSIDAVLENKKHDYLYFCAKPESNGGHLFAESLTQHNRNARVYHNWLNKQGIR